MSGQPSLIVVGDDGGHRIRLRRRRDAGRLAHVGERAVAVVVEQLHEAGRQAARPAVDRHALPAAIGAFARLGQLLERRVEIARDQQIEAAVAVVVDPRAAAAVAGRGRRQPRLRRHVGEGAVAVVAIQGVVAVAGDEQVVEAVVVEVADGHRRRPAGAGQSGFRRDVGEGAVAVVLVEAIGGFGRRGLQPGPAQHQHVEPAVVVVVEERHAAAHDLDDVALAVDTAVDGRLRQPGLARDVGEAGVERQAGRLAARRRPDGTRRHALGQGRRRSQQAEPGEPRSGEQRHQRAAGHHRRALRAAWAAGSVATSVRPAATCSNLWTAPLGHRISTSFADVSSPSPTSTRRSLADR